MRRWSLVVLALVMSVTVVALSAAVATAQEVPRVTKEELKAMLDSPDLVLIDMRIGKDWTASDLKIKGAVREDPEEAEALTEKYPKDKTLVLYCA